MHPPPELTVNRLGAAEQRTPHECGANANRDLNIAPLVFVVNTAVKIHALNEP